MSSRRYKTFIDTSSEGIWLLEFDIPIDTSLPLKQQVKLIFDRGRFAQANAALVEMHGETSAKHVEGKQLQDLIVRDDPQNIDYFTKFITSSYRLSGVESHQKDIVGIDKYFRTSLVGIVENGFLVSAWGTQHDISEYHHATESLKKSEERLALTLKSNNMGAWEWDLETDQQIWSDEVKMLFGLPTTYEFTYERYLRLIHADDQKRMKKALSKALRNGSDYQVELKVNWPNGDTHWILSQGKVLHNNDKPARILGTIMNIDYHKLYEIRLQESEERFRTMADTAPVLIWVTDIHMRCVYFNKPWLEFTGRTPEQEYGQGWTKGIHLDDMERYMQTCKEASDKRIPFSIEFSLLRHDGVYRLVLNSAAPRFSVDKEFLGYVGSCVDIEDVKQANIRAVELKVINKKLRLQRKQLVALNKTKDEFISLASHQLRTPATGVKQYLGMLLDGYAGQLSEAQKSMLNTAYESNERELSIVNDLLRVAQLDAGKIALKKEKTNLVKVVKDIIDEHTATFKSRRQRIIYNHPSRPISACIDPGKMSMVLDNLIDNASKYTSSGKQITVTIQNNPTNVRIAIQDEGIGIALEDIPQLFQKFLRLDNTVGLNVEGNGLGLYWAKKIIQLHKATIKVTSELHKGSTFIVTIPKNI